MPCIGVKFIHRIGGRFDTPSGLLDLLRDREVDAAEGDVIEVSIAVTRAAQATKCRRLMAWLKRIGDAPRPSSTTPEKP
jgi:hypothetical protein